MQCCTVKHLSNPLTYPSFGLRHALSKTLSYVNRPRGHRAVPRSNLAYRGRTSATYNCRATQAALFFALGRTCIHDDGQTVLLWRCAKKVRALQPRLNDRSDGFAGRERLVLNPSAERRGMPSRLSTLSHLTTRRTQARTRSSTAASCSDRPSTSATDAHTEHYLIDIL